MGMNLQTVHRSVKLIEPPKQQQQQSQVVVSVKTFVERTTSKAFDEYTSNLAADVSDVFSDCHFAELFALSHMCVVVGIFIHIY